MMNKAAKAAYHQQRGNAIRRGIPWLFTFEQWWQVWQESGHWEQRGRRKGEFVMSRPGDRGPYSVGNVVIVTNKVNFLEAKALAGKDRGGVYCTHPGTPKPWQARYGRKMLGFFATQEEALHCRKSYEATLGDSAKPGPKPGAQFSEEHRQRLSEAATKRRGLTFSAESLARIGAGVKAAHARRREAKEKSP